MPQPSVTRLQQRRARERDLVDATRRLFDERGVQEAPMDAIARAVGIPRALVYRYVESKEELFVLTVTRYLDEMTERAGPRLAGAPGPVEQLRAAWENLADYCLEYPAFLDCALSLMRRPGAELRARVTESTWFRLGRSMSACLAVTIDILTRGRDQGVFAIGDPALTANCLYTQTLGLMHLARSGVGVTELAPGVPSAFALDAADVRTACVEATLRLVGAQPADTWPRGARRSRGFRDPRRGVLRAG